MNTRAYEQRSGNSERTNPDELRETLDRLAQVITQRSRQPAGGGTSSERSAPTIDSSTEQFFESVTRAVLRALDDRAERSGDRSALGGLSILVPFWVGALIGGMPLSTPPQSGGEAAGEQ